MAKAVAPPSATGPAGQLFEAQVAGSYLLAMLRGSEPRGLPGAVFDRIALQRAAEGHPLDDVVVHAHDARGDATTLEVQVKRSITFAPQDPEFRTVVAQISEALKQPAFAEGRVELAIATNQTSRVITGPIQDVLSQARKMESAAGFMARLERPGSANKNMRAFVKTLRDNLAAAGAPSDDPGVWAVLRRLQIHVYDFDTLGSMHESYARDRAADVLHTADKDKAGPLWDSLVGRALELASVGGATTRDQLRVSLGDYRFDGDRRYSVIRAAIGEAAQHALSDMADQVHGVMLDRVGLVAAVREATLRGRYVEVRGDAGVGKSGLLRHLAEEVGRESRILVLAPNRIAERGWSTMRAQFQFEGTLRDLLTDLASDGGGWVFIDNLDGYSLTERLTVIDVVRAASEVPGIIVIATARRRFGVDEPSWLPETAIQSLGPAPPVSVGELADAEVAELRADQPRLHALLAKDHPARNVTRNLFRLARLARAPADQPPRSEVDMAEQWWRTADGDEPGRRERARLLRELAAQALKGSQVFNVSTHDAATVDALIKTETLRDLANDRVTFRHDVLREWAIANLLVSDRSLVADLPLGDNASPTLARGAELFARLPLEKHASPDRWCEALDALSGAGTHPSWRRAGLLALVHSELVEDLIPVASETLIANDAALLRELLPIIMAVDVLPVRDMCAAVGLDASLVPETLNMPRGPHWYPLATWLLALKAKLPTAAMPEVVDFLIGWLSVGLILPDAVSVAILKRFKEWLTEIDASNDAENWGDERSVFGGKLHRTQVKRMEEDLRTYLVLLANRVPEDARMYLASVQTLKRKEDIYAKLLRVRGTLAQAAPEELARLTVDALVRPPEDRQRDRVLEDAFTYVDHQFLPESPGQGPFFDLLTHAPAIGLKLIRELVDRAIMYHTNGKSPADDDVLVVQTAAGPRRFTWIKTYGWSRSSHYHAITSALMALETWAHARIEKGNALDEVIADLVGQPDAPAAYALLVVDMLLSHWPATREAAVPYVACPELLSLDLSRPAQENIELPDFFGLKALQQEPAGPKLEALRKRVSRRVSLDALLPRYANHEGAKAHRDHAAALLHDTLVRLGAFEGEDDLSVPRLMAVHAINLLDPANYVDVEAEQADGTKVTAHQFVPPEAEAKHFAPLQEKGAARQTAAQMALAINALVDHPERSRQGVAEALARWAQSEKGEDAQPEAVNQAVVGAALIAMRDGTAELRSAERDWAERVFASALDREADHVGARMRPGMLYNPLAMAFAGRVFALTGVALERADYKRLLNLAAREPAAAHGAQPTAHALRALDARLPRALLRVAFGAALYTWLPWNATEATKAATTAARDASLKQRIDAELAWLCDGAAEPGWPDFPSDSVRVRERRRLRIGAAPPNHRTRARATRNQHVDHQSAALWLRSLWRPSDRDWLQDVSDAYIEWTLAANGAGLSDDEESGERPSEWNSIFFAVMANCIPGRTQAEAEARVASILDLSDEHYYDVSADFLRSIDAVYFNDEGLDGKVAAGVRAQFAERLARSYGWRRLRGTKSDGVELHLGPAAAVHFFNDHHFGQGPKCYLFAKAAPASDVFIGALQNLAVSAPSVFVAILVLNWLEVSPRPTQMPLLVAFAGAAIEAYPNDRQFWVDHGIGRRVCVWLEAIRELDADAFEAGAAHRAAVDRLLARLVGVGVVEARRLEMALAGQIGEGG